MNLLFSTLRLVFRFLRPWFSLIVFYLLVMEMTLLIFGYSFNFQLLSKEQFHCRQKIDRCLSTYIYQGINDRIPCPAKCLENLIVTLEGYYEYNFFTQLINDYMDGK